MKIQKKLVKYTISIIEIVTIFTAISAIVYPMYWAVKGFINSKPKADLITFIGCLELWFLTIYIFGLFYVACIIGYDLIKKKYKELRDWSHSE